MIVGGKTWSESLERNRSIGYRLETVFFCTDQYGGFEMTRDRRIDTIRGILLAIMTIDHFGGYFRNFTYQPFGYVSAAEGFVFLSGYVCMEAYGIKLGKKDFLKPLYRGLKIYKYHIFIAVTIGLIASAIPQYSGYWHRDLGLYYKDPLEAIAFTAILLNQPTYMDILPMYSIFLVLFPISLHLIRIGKIKVVFLLVFPYGLSVSI